MTDNLRLLLVAFGLWICHQQKQSAPQHLPSGLSKLVFSNLYIEDGIWKYVVLGCRQKIKKYPRHFLARDWPKKRFGGNFFDVGYRFRLPPGPFSPFAQKMGQNNYSSVTMPPISNLRPLFTLQLLILPTRTPFHAKKAKTKSKNWGFCISSFHTEIITLSMVSHKINVTI